MTEKYMTPKSQIPESLRRMLEDDPLHNPYPETIPATDPVQSLWLALTNWTPTDAQVRHCTDWLLRAGVVATRILNFSVIATALYLAFEIGLAFLPGGAAAHVLGGR
jgi:hypothetical protein